ncbi:MAG: DUF87 domain-containing protein [Planctomycetaceae bacterium]
MPPRSIRSDFMMLPIRVGTDLDSGLPVELDPEALSRHLHIAGATGTGKTVALHAVLRPIMKQPGKKSACIFVIDPLGGLSRDLLMWIASPRCPSHVRNRLVYIEPANNDVVVPFNPLRSAVGDDRFYHVARTVDLIMRAWQAQDMGQQPRLMQWSYAAMSAIAEMQLPIAVSEYLLHPGSDEHKAILRRLPDGLRHRWLEILNAKGSEPTRILESTRNRFDPIYSAPHTRRMLGVIENRLDVERMIRERKIVILNVAKLGKIPHLLGNTIGALVLNEIFETAFRMATVYGRKTVDPTLVVLDEFQRFAASPDIEDALPTVRQVGLKLLMAHQSFSQLEQGDIDLRSMIFQAQNRLMFANSAEDADIVANELAILSFDQKLVKHELYQRKQLIKGHRIVWLESEGFSDTQADSTVNQRSFGYNRSSGTSQHSDATGTTRSDGSGSSDGRVEGSTRAVSRSTSRGRSQSHLPEYDDFRELSSVQYTGFDEQLLEWMKTIRNLRTGNCFGKFVDHPHLYRILIDHNPVRATQRAEARYRELLQQNYEQDFFISRQEADRLAEEARRKLLEMPRIELSRGQPVAESPEDTGADAGPEDTSRSKSPDPFRRPEENE